MKIKKNHNNIHNIKLGAHVRDNGVSFSIFSRNATKVWLLIFKKKNGKKPDYIFELNKNENKFGDIWTVFVEGISVGFYYLWKMDGPYEPDKGLLFNKKALLIDPYAKAITGRIDAYPNEKNESSKKHYSNPQKMAKGIICAEDFDWEGDKPLNKPLNQIIIYETHIKGLTAHRSSNVKFPGTYKGIIEKIPYFKELGINAIEFLPVNEFSIYKDNRVGPDSKKKLNNYWGYNTLGFFAPNESYSTTKGTGEQVIEFKKMVKALHKADIEIILDVVFNHTVEGGKFDKIVSFKGIENNIYYLLNPKNGEYLDYTGCGNTFNCNHPIVTDFILDCLHYWVLEMHVDGFRFDLASALNRNEEGKLLNNSVLIRRIEESPFLRDTKIIAEAWDAGGGYQVGDFTGRWAEWNGKYRDDVRKFWRGDCGSLGNFATRITGSSDLFNKSGRSPQQSINFIFSHDGYTMWDWASYNNKYNLKNGHNNKDGENNNFSYNHGKEGVTKNSKILKLREKQAKNLITTLIFSLGTPMINGGDEFLRTQQGNNNPYCQDNSISWFNWQLLENNKNIFNFFKELIKLRNELYMFFDRDFYMDKKSIKEEDIEIKWFGPAGKKPDWNGSDLSLGALIKSPYSIDLFIMFNSNNNKRIFYLPDNKKDWIFLIDTSKEPPDDIIPIGKNIKHKENKITIKSKSVLILKRGGDEYKKKKINTRNK